jgi:hypothetical protein
MTAIAEANSLRFHISESKCSSVSLTSYSWHLLSRFSVVQVIDWNPAYHKSCRKAILCEDRRRRCERPSDPVTQLFHHQKFNLSKFQSYVEWQDLYWIKIVSLYLLRVYLIFIKYLLRNKVFQTYIKYILEVLQILKPLKSVQFCIYFC